MPLSWIETIGSKMNRICYGTRNGGTVKYSTGYVDRNPVAKIFGQRASTQDDCQAKKIKSMIESIMQQLRIMRC